jgi:hypothetical protein
MGRFFAQVLPKRCHEAEVPFDKLREPDSYQVFKGCPQEDSNLRPCLRRAVLYPLSYGGPGWNQP